MSDPSPERLRRARAQGDVPVAHRLSVCAQLAAALALGDVTARALRGAFEGSLQGAVAAASSPSPSVAASALARAGAAALRASGPTLVACAAAMALAHLAQTRFLFVWPTRAAGSARGEAAVAALWGAAVAAAGLSGAWDALREATGVAAIGRVAEAAAWRVVLCGAALGVAEFAWRRARFLRTMTPTRAEAERERREAEGDPRARAAMAQGRGTVG